MKGPRWTEEEEARLMGVYMRVSPAELEAMFGRSYKGIRDKANKLGLSNERGPTKQDFDDAPVPAMDLLDSLACIRLRKWAHDCANTEADLRPHKGVACG